MIYHDLTITNEDLVGYNGDYINEPYLFIFHFAYLNILEQYPWTCQISLEVSAAIFVPHIHAVKCLLPPRWPWM